MLSIFVCEKVSHDRYLQLNKIHRKFQLDVFIYDGKICLPTLLQFFNQNVKEFLWELLKDFSMSRYAKLH